MLLRRNRTDGKLQVLFFPRDDPSDSFHQEHMPVPTEGNYLEKKKLCNTPFDNFCFPWLL